MPENNPPSEPSPMASNPDVAGAQQAGALTDTTQAASTERAALTVTQLWQRSSRANPNAAAPLPCQFGEYELLEELGRGGMGVVYKARQMTANRLVALKIIRPEHLSRFLPDDRKIALARFRNEAQAAARLQHDHVVTVYDVGEFEGQSYYAMRYVEGDSLKERVANGPLAPEVAARYLEQVSLGLAEAHAAGILHRDLKPHNIMVDRRTDRAMLADFGLAKLTEGDQELTATSAQMGSPPYMSPEQTRDSGKVTTASDIYGLGATLYHVLTARPPFQAASAHETLAQVQSQEPVSPRALNAAVPRDLETICLKCLEKDPAKRYSRADDVAAELGRCQRGEPILARPIGRLERAGRWCRRNPVVAGLATLTLLVLVAGLAVSTTLAIVATQRGQTATERAEKLKQANESLIKAVAAEKAAKEAETKERRLAAAAATAERQAKEAEAVERRRAQVVSDFLQQVFRSPDPSRAGRTITVAEVLDGSVKSLADQLHDEPQTKVALLSAIADAYVGMGLYPDAVQVRRQAHELSLAKLGPKHPETLTTMNNLAIAFHAAGQLDDSLPLQEEVLRRTKELLGAEDPETLPCMNNLAAMYERAGRFSDAVALFKEVLRVNEKIHGKDHPETLRVMNNLAFAQHSAGDVKEAIALYERALKFEIALHGEQQPSTLMTMSNLGMAYADMRRYQEALPLTERALLMRKEKLGEDHPDTLVSMNNLGMLYGKLGRYADALALNQSTFEAMRTKLGADHPDTLRCMNNLAMSYENTGNASAALPLYEESLRLRTAKYGPDHADTLRAMQNLAQAYEQNSRYAEALPLLQQAFQRSKSALGSDHPDTLLAMRSLAAHYRQTNLSDQALPLYEEALKLTKARFGPEHPETFTAMDGLASTLRDAKKFDDALAIYQESLGLREKHLGAEHPQTLRSMNNLALAYKIAGRLRDAIALYEPTLKAQRKALGEEHPEVLSTMNNLAFAYESDGRIPEAIELLEQSLAPRRKALGDQHPKTLTTINGLARIYCKLDRFQEAHALLEELVATQKARLGPEHEDTLSAMNCLAMTKVALDRASEAAALCEEVLAIETRTHSQPRQFATASLEMAKKLAELSDEERQAMADLKSWQSNDCDVRLEFRREGEGWVQLQDDKRVALLQAPHRGAGYVDLYDSNRKFWMRLTIDQAFTSNDRLFWTRAETGGPSPLAP
jgi:tetratricopeptide (TPR) repeat protein/tRNA A-37 threonylcarbamoyl transferase component Bud32